MFGYGSLIWRPGFDIVERVPARVIGLHRSLCVYSFVHRGTPERPGLVLGLDRGGACRGVAYRVAAKKRAATLAYLRAREQATTSISRSCARHGSPASRNAGSDAVCYVVDRSHPQYAGRLDARRSNCIIVRQGHGRSGHNRDYVLETVTALEALGCRDTELHLLAERLKGTYEAQAPSLSAPSGHAVARRHWRCRCAASSRSPSAIRRAVAVSMSLLQAREERRACRARAGSDRGTRPRSCPASAGTTGAARTGRS